MSATVFASTESAPSVGGLHLIGAFQLYQVDHIITCQQSKRRGGPKRVVMQYRVVDDRQAKGSSSSSPVREICWKTIAQKNFSNRENISQYERNPFGSMRDNSAVEGHMVVLHGARSAKGISNTVGVNVAGKSLGQHPRFLLSSGKGENGARSTILIYSANAYAHVELAKVWIEHKELKVTVEQIDENELDAAVAARAMVTFAAKFKHVYAQREEDGSMSEAAMSDVLPAAAVSKPVPMKRASTHTKWSPAAALSRDSSHLSMKTAPERITPAVLPPQAMPQAFADRLITRKRSFDALESPVANAEEPLYKKECTESAISAYDAVPGFAGFDVYDDLMAHSLVLDESMLIHPESGLLGEVADDDSLRSDDATPRVGTTPPPFRHSISSGSEQSTDSASSMEDTPGEFNLAEMVCFEQSLEKYQPQQESACFEPMDASPTIPHELASAHLLSGNPFSFAPVDLKAIEPAAVMMLPAHGFLGGFPYACSPPPTLFDTSMNDQCRRQQLSTLPPASSPPPLLPHTSSAAVGPSISRSDPYAGIFGPPGISPSLPGGLPRLPSTMTLTSLLMRDRKITAH